jgi:predicted lipid-binding transport protein (Tim44 family)
VTFLHDGDDRVASEIWTFARDARTRGWRLRNAQAT